MRALIAGAFLLFAHCSPQPASFLERTVSVGGRTYGYRVWLPPHYTKFRRWPVILYLHGSGERGDDNAAQMSIGLPAQLVRTPSRYPAIVVIPQCRRGQEWYGEMERQALAALDASVREFRGDRRRIYLTGISMGGAGVWYFGRHPGRFAALVPVCGEVVRQPSDPFPLPLPADLERVLASANPYEILARAIGRTPVWAFHGGDDTVIPPAESQRMFAALEAAGGVARYTELGGVGHDVWDAAYENPELAQWLLRQRKPVSR